MTRPPGKVRGENDVCSGWTYSDKPLLSIVCMTYNHADFIEVALEGILMQKTSFPFEVVVHDDASTDGTTEILAGYSKRYPNLIRPVVQEKNQYSKGKKPFILVYPELRGKYVAICEGDDYWTDPLKLEKQVAFLEDHPEYVISGHDACIIDENDTSIQSSKLPDAHKRDYSAKDLLEGRAFVLTLSWVFRRVLADDEAVAERSVVVNGDTFMLSLLGQYGGAHYHDDIDPAVYRQHHGGVWSMLDSESRRQSHVTTFLMISNYYRRIGQDEIADIWWQRFNNLMVGSLPNFWLAKEVFARLRPARILRSILNRVKSWLRKT